MTPSSQGTRSPGIPGRFTPLDGEMIDHLVRTVLDSLRSPTPDRVSQLAPMVPMLRYSLVQFGDHFAALATWFRHDVQWESHALVEVGRTHRWKQDMIGAYREVMAVLSDLESQVARMMDAYAALLVAIGGATTACSGQRCAPPLMLSVGL